LGFGKKHSKYLSGIKSTFIGRNKKSNQRKYKSNTLGFEKKHYKCRSRIKSTFVGKKRKKKTKRKYNSNNLRF
jgi:hypothetical protein